jgi:Tfp pilus assembly protein PilN
MIADTIGTTGRVGIVGASAMRKALTSALADLRVVATPPAGEWTAISERSDALAAQFAGSDLGPVLRADDSVAVLRGAARRLSVGLAAAAAVVLIMAGLVELWGVHRQLRAVQAERARLRPQIASTLLGRTTVDATSRNLAALNAIDRSAPQWSTIITTLSESVPDDAYFTAIRARQDSLIVDGLAEHAARVFDALSKTPTLIDVKAAAPVRRELQDDGTPLDHFTIAARIFAPAPSAPKTSPVVAPSSGGAARRPSQ